MRIRGADLTKDPVVRFSVMAGRVPTACTDLGNDPPRPCLVPSWHGRAKPGHDKRETTLLRYP